MNAADIMTRDVTAIKPDMPKRHIAALFVSKKIGAVPVVDETGVPIGIVTAADMILQHTPANAEETKQREWWLTLLAEGEPLHPDFLATLEETDPVAREIMSSPAITVADTEDVAEVARLLTTRHIKQLPVVNHEGKLVGIVGRFDLIRAMASEQPEVPHSTRGRIMEWVGAHTGRNVHHRQAEAPSMPAPPADDTNLTVTDFRHLVADHENLQDRQRREQHDAEMKHRRERVRELVDTHISREEWRNLIHRARLAAENGEKEFLLLRFPSQLCSDGGRAINAPNPDWPETLRGEAAEIYLLWEHQLRPQGFRLAARIIDFPDGVPGDAGLFLVWGS
jgi:CBS domain-containing protein